MKKSFMLLVVACVIGGSHALAQEKISYGIKAGVNVATYSFSDEDEYYDNELKKRPAFSFHIGGLVDVPIAPAFSLQGGLTLSGKGYRETWSGEDEFDGTYYEGSFRENIMVLEIPVNAVYKTGQFFFGAGPYVAYALSGKWKEKFEEDFGDGDVEKDEESGKVVFSGESAYRTRTDFGINLLAGYQLNTQLNISAGYGFGIKDIHPGPDWSGKNRVISLSVGYMF